MQWKQALDRTIAEWEAIRDRIGDANPVELIAEINAVCEVCDKAVEEADHPGDRCRYCIVFGNEMTCRDLRFRMTEALIDEDWKKSRSEIDRMLSLFREARDATVE